MKYVEMIVPMKEKRRIIFNAKIVNILPTTFTIFEDTHMKITKHLVVKITKKILKKRWSKWRKKRLL